MLQSFDLGGRKSYTVAIAQHQAVPTAAATAKALDAKTRSFQDAMLRAVAEDEAFAVETAAAAGVGAHHVQIMASYEARSRAMTKHEAVAAAVEAAKNLEAQATAAKAATARAAVAVDIADAAVKVLKAQALGTQKKKPRQWRKKEQGSGSGVWVGSARQNRRGDNAATNGGRGVGSGVGV